MADVPPWSRTGDRVSSGPTSARFDGRHGFHEAAKKQDACGCQWPSSPFTPASAMHCALLIDELVRSILQHCEDDASTQAARQRVFHALALTSNVFREAALDQLWSRLPSVVPLMALIPGLFVQDGTFVSPLTMECRVC
jgi:hypothetical protein